MPIGQHIVMRLASNAPIATSPEARRILAHVVLDKARATGANVLSFGLPDSHLHICAACSRKKAGELSRSVSCSLHRQLDLESPFARPFFKDIDDSSHLRNAFRYVLTQDRHHGIDCDPLREGTNLPDLLKMRICGEHTLETVHQFLPRLTQDELLALCGLKQLKLLDGSLDKVVLATLVASGLGDLQGSSAEVRRARRAAIEVIGRRLPAHAVGDLLGIRRRRVYEMLPQPVDDSLVLAIKRQLYAISLLPAAALSPLRELAPAAASGRHRLLAAAAARPDQRRPR